MESFHSANELSASVRREHPGYVSRRLRTIGWPAVAALLVSACALSPTDPSTTPAAPPETAVTGDYLTQYLLTLERVAASDPSLAPGETAAQHPGEPSSQHASANLHRALVVGAAGRPGSDPLAASRMLKDLLASTHDLKPAEVSLAQVFLKEFEARAALLQAIDRDRAEHALQLKSASVDESRRVAALGAENARLRKALANAERKLSEVAEIERSLLEEVPSPDETPSPPPP